MCKAQVEEAWKSGSVEWKQTYSGRKEAKEERFIKRKRKDKVESKS